jgi:peroxiredoxin
MPARYVIDQQSVVHYAAADPDYTVRPEPQDTINALQQLGSGRT